jgi:hypothetical protein
MRDEWAVDGRTPFTAFGRPISKKKNNSNDLPLTLFFGRKCIN